MQTNPLDVQAKAFLDGAARGKLYLEQASSRKVCADTGRINALAPDFPQIGMTTEAVLDLLETVGGEGTVATAGGRYFGYVLGGALPTASAARALLSAWDQVADRLTGPSVIKMEETAISWITSLLGLPKETSGAFTTGATMANLTSLVTARDVLLERQGHARDAGLIGASEIRIVASREIHATVLKSLRMAGLGSRNVEWVSVDDQGRMEIDDLPDLDSRTIVLAQAGNVCTGATDPLVPLGEVCRATGAWLHVDGAFGLWARVASNVNTKLDGLELADSWGVDSHKTLNTPYDSGLALCRHPEEMRKSMAMGASYLPATEKSPSDCAPEFSRSARGAETWAALLSLGNVGLVEMIDRFHQHALCVAEELRKIGFEVPHDVHFNQVFATLSGNENACEAIVKHVQESGEAWFGAATWQGHKGFRISVSNWATTKQDIDRLIAAIKTAKSVVLIGACHD